MTLGLHHLARAIPRGATYDSPECYARAGCYPGTREAIKSDIVRWVQDEETEFLWIHGPAGAGKSAIAQSVAELLGDKGPEAAPLATFFFSRDDAQRNCGDWIFSTIAYQLAVSIPETRDRIENAIDQNPTIITSSMQTQFESLLLAPLRDLATQSPGRLFPIIVDGLDECLDEKVQDQILQLLRSLIRYLLPVRIIIASRPESHIRNTISDMFHDSSLLRILELKHTEAVDQEIRLYLRGGFKNIYTDKNHRHVMQNIQKPWPSDEEIERLIEKASGQFIYASTVLKYVGDRYFRPPDQLRNILGEPHIPTEALADLNSLYCQILSNNPHRDRMLDVLGFIVVILRTEGASSIFPILLVVEQLLGLEHGETHLALRNLHSLIDLPEPESFTSCPPYSHNPSFFHATFPDFLTDRARAGDFFIDDHQYHLRMKNACIMVITKLPRSGHTHDGHSCSYGNYYLKLWLRPSPS
jgi:energy-coupling factor transporter ATP-binding protein EcfA2